MYANRLRALLAIAVLRDWERDDMIAGFISLATGTQLGGLGSVWIWILFFSTYSRSVKGCWRVTYLSVSYTPKDMGHMHTIPSERSMGHTNESENRQEALSREHVEYLEFGRKVESWKALSTMVLDDLLCFYSGSWRIKYFIIHKFRRLRFSKWMSFENPS